MIPVSSPSLALPGRRLAAGLLLVVLLVPLAGADETWHDLHDAVRRGRFVPLPEILDWLEARYAGQVLEVELERHDGRVTYEIEMLGPQGQVVEFEFDAENGELVGVEGTDIESMRREGDGE